MTPQVLVRNLKSIFNESSSIGGIPKSIFNDSSSIGHIPRKVYSIASQVLVRYLEKYIQ